MLVECWTQNFSKKNFQKKNFSSKIHFYLMLSTFPLFFLFCFILAGLGRVETQSFVRDFDFFTNFLNLNMHIGGPFSFRLVLIWMVIFILSHLDLSSRELNPGLCRLISLYFYIDYIYPSYIRIPGESLRSILTFICHFWHKMLCKTAYGG